jgi:hypothetical protein
MPYGRNSIDGRRVYFEDDGGGGGAPVVVLWRVGGLARGRAFVTVRSLVIGGQQPYRMDPDTALGRPVTESLAASRASGTMESFVDALENWAGAPLPEDKRALWLENDPAAIEAASAAMLAEGDVAVHLRSWQFRCLLFVGAADVDFSWERSVRRVRSPMRSSSLLPVWTTSVHTWSRTRCWPPYSAHSAQMPKRTSMSNRSGSRSVAARAPPPRRAASRRSKLLRVCWGCRPGSGCGPAVAPGCGGTLRPSTRASRRRPRDARRRRPCSGTVPGSCG